MLSQKKQVDSLKSENLSLKEENERLVLSLKDGGREMISRFSASPPVRKNDHLRYERSLQRKLEILEQIERDQKERERELDRYHSWLHSIPVNRSGREPTLEMKDRFTLLENSIAMQTKELERTKLLFMRDLKIVKTELEEKEEDLHVSEAKVLSLQKEISRLREELRYARSDVRRSRSNSQIEANDVMEGFNLNIRDVRKVMEHYDAISTGMASKLNIEVNAFKKNLANNLKDQIFDIVTARSDEERHEAVDDVFKLVDGCAEALRESIQSSYRCYSESITIMLKRLLKIIGSQRGAKNFDGTRRDDSQLQPPQHDQLQLDKQDPLFVKIKQILHESLASSDMPFSAAGQQYWQTILHNIDKSREFQSQLYINAMSMRNTMTRVLDLVREFEKMTGSQGKDMYCVSLMIMLT